MILGLTNRLLVVDAETCSAVDLKKHGGARYWASPSTRVLMIGFQEYGHDQEFLYQPHLGTIPGALPQFAALPSDEGLFVAFNARFDRQALARTGIETPAEKWLDLQLLAYILAFSGGLDDVLTQFDVKDDLGRPCKKSAEGQRLIGLFSKRQTPWYDAPELWARFCEYCRQDVRVEVALLKKCLAVLDRPVFYPMLRELQDQWLLNQRINARGIPVSMATVQGALRIKERETARLEAEIRTITGGANPNSPKQLLAWVRDQGASMPDLKAETVRETVADPTLPDPVRRVLDARLQVGKASVKKFVAFADKHLNGRLHDCYTLCGASRTGRDASRGINLANLERPKLKDLDRTADLVELGCPETLRAFLGPKDEKLGTMDVLGSCVRAAIKAPDGYGITAVDLKSIESVGLAWLAGCDTILDLFFAGKDSYIDYATRYYRIPYDQVTPEQRTFCKPPVLGSGFGAGASALVRYAAKLGVTLTEEVAENMVRVFRESFPEIPLFWKNLDNAAKAAVLNRGQLFTVYACDTFSQYGPSCHTYKPWPYITYYYDGTFLYCGLPSGRTLFYYNPTVETVNRTSRKTNADGLQRTYNSTNLFYYGKDQAVGGSEEGGWKRISTHGGKLAENDTQAVCRDVLYPALQEIDNEPLIELFGSTYDEAMALTRLDDPTGYDRMHRALTRRRPWMDDRFFLGAAGYHNAKRYRKD